MGFWLLLASILLLSTVAIAQTSPPDATFPGQQYHYNSVDAFSALYYVKASYCNVTQLKDWSCGACQRYHPNLTHVQVAQDELLGTLGFTGYDPVRNEIVVSIRGTSNFLNFVEDMGVKQVPYLVGRCAVALCMVHAGFLVAWEGVHPTLMAQFESLWNFYGGGGSDTKIVVTGHSLGAAMALYAALDIVDLLNSTKHNMTRDSIPMSVFTFGQPRVGDWEFALYAMARLPQGKVFRVTHRNDPIPKLPPMMWKLTEPLLWFMHPPHELWYNNSIGTGEIHCQDDVGIIPPMILEDLNCSDSVPVDIFHLKEQLYDHVMYLGECTDCEKQPTGNPLMCSL